MDFYKEFLIDSVSIIVRKREKPYYKKVFGRRAVGSGFVYFLSGNGTYTDKYGAKIEFRENDFLLVEYGEPYTIETEESEIEYVTTAFSLNEKSSFSDFGLPTFFRATDDSFRIKVISLLRAWEKNSVYSKMEARLLLNEIFLEIRKAIKPDTATDTSSPLDDAVSYINKNYEKEISLKELASLCMMSESYFRSQFKREMGVSAIKYREEVRISWAKKYLRTNLFSATEIAGKLGYCDIYHFSKAFKSHTGMSPSEYKKKKSPR